MKGHTEVIVDATCGNGGHSYHIAFSYKNSIKVLYCFDKDTDSLKIAKERLKEFNFIKYINRTYTHLGNVLTKEGKMADFILFDLGLSMWQIKSSKRGFSFKSNEILDMRFNPNEGIPLFVTLKKIDPITLSHVLKTYGDVKGAKNIATHIVRERKRKEIRTTWDLIEVLKQIHVSEKEVQKIFMALRIYVNNELIELAKGIPEALKYAKKGGILAFITYHSVEDRIVKKIAQLSYVKKIKPYPIKPTQSEIKNNKAARSAKLRAFIKGEDYAEETTYTFFTSLVDSFPTPLFGT